MTKRKKTFLGTVKKAWVSLQQGIKRIAGAAQEKIEVDSQFAKAATRIDRLNKGMVHLDAAFFAVFDKVASTLTFREGEHLEKGELVEADHGQYRVLDLGLVRVDVSVEVNHRVHLLPCRVATLAKV